MSKQVNHVILSFSVGLLPVGERKCNLIIVNADLSLTCCHFLQVQPCQQKPLLQSADLNIINMAKVKAKITGKQNASQHT